MADAQLASDPSWDALVRQATSSATEGTEISRQLGESARVKSGIATRLLKDRPPPAPQIPPPAPPPAPMQQTDPLQSFGSFATVLGIVGGMLTRQPLTASLNAATGAMNAYKQRDLEAYKRNYEAWKAQSDYLGKVAEWQQSQYKMALDQHKIDQDALIATMNAIAARDQDLVMQHTIRTGDLRNVMQLLADRDLARDRYQRAQTDAERLGEDRRHHLEQEKDAQRRTQIILGKGTGKLDEQVKELQFLKTDANDLLDRVTADPTLVGGKGMFRRGLQAVTGQVTPEEELHDKEAVKLKADIVALQARLMPLIKARYFSGPAARMAEELVTGLGKFDDPDSVKASLETLNRMIDQDIATKSSASSMVNQNLKDLSNEEILNRLGIQP